MRRTVYVELKSKKVGKIRNVSGHWQAKHLKQLSSADEVPIIEQEIERVTHALSPDDFVTAGRDIESRLLARAVKMHLENRVKRLSLQRSGVT